MTWQGTPCVALPGVPAAIAAALVAESAPARAGFRARVVLVAAAGRELRRLPRSSGRQPSQGERRLTFGSVCASAGLSQKRARTWQDVAIAAPRLDDYLEDARLGDRELSVAGLVRFAKPAAPRPGRVACDAAWPEFLADLDEHVGVLVEALDADPTGRPLGIIDLAQASSEFEQAIAPLRQALADALREFNEFDKDEP